MHARLFLGSLLLLPLMACARTEPVPAPGAPDPPAEPCPFVYVYAPGNYIIDIASGAEVVLDPGVRDFELFCSPGEARTAITAAVDKGTLPEGDWRIYRLDGSLDDLAHKLPHRRYQLNRMAQVVDWVTENI